MDIQFYFRPSKGNLKTKAGLGKISFVISQKNTKPIERSTFIVCKKDEWNDTEKVFTGTGAIANNNRLDRIKLNFELILNKPDTTQEDLNNFFESLETPVVHLKTFLEVFDEYLAFQESKIRDDEGQRTELTIERSTYETYLKRKNNIVKFLTMKNKSRINVGKFDGKLCEEFDMWCVGKIGGQAYSNKHLKLIRSVLEFARRMRYITHNPTSDYKIKKDPSNVAIAAVNALKQVSFGNHSTVNTISNENIEKLETFTEFTYTEQKYVDAFLFMRECWLHIGDYLELDDTHFKIDEYKNYWIVKPRTKRMTDSGGQVQIMPLSPKAVEILNKYDKNFNGELSLLPRAKRSGFMQYLKMACVRAGIQEHITLKYARSNGISNIYNNTNVRAEQIAFGAGWTSTNPLKNYLKHDFNQMRKDFLNIKQAA